MLGNLLFVLVLTLLGSAAIGNMIITLVLIVATAVFATIVLIWLIVCSCSGSGRNRGSRSGQIWVLVVVGVGVIRGGGVGVVCGGGGVVAVVLVKLVNFASINLPILTPSMPPSLYEFLLSCRCPRSHTCRVSFLSLS